VKLNYDWLGEPVRASRAPRSELDVEDRRVLAPLAPPRHRCASGFRVAVLFTRTRARSRCVSDFSTPPTWSAVLTENPAYYEQECSEAWAAARSAGYVDAFNNPTPDWVASAEWAVPGRYFTDQTVIDTLTADGSSITDWVKVKSPKFETAHGEAEMHLYKNVRTGAINLSRGWKLVFKEIF
jgi:hypothetical protein